MKHVLMLALLPLMLVGCSDDSNPVAPGSGEPMYGRWEGWVSGIDNVVYPLVIDINAARLLVEFRYTPLLTHSYHFASDRNIVARVQWNTMMVLDAKKADYGEFLNGKFYDMGGAEVGTFMNLERK